MNQEINTNPKFQFYNHSSWNSSPLHSPTVTLTKHFYHPAHVGLHTCLEGRIRSRVHVRGVGRSCCCIAHWETSWRKIKNSAILEPWLPEACPPLPSSPRLPDSGQEPSSSVGAQQAVIKAPSSGLWGATATNTPFQPMGECLQLSVTENTRQKRN